MSQEVELILTRCSAQDHKTLEAFYKDLATNYPHHTASARAMLELINRLTSAGESGVREDGPIVFGMTSHVALVFLSEDDYRAPRHVSVTHHKGEYRIQYLPPGSNALPTASSDPPARFVWETPFGSTPSVEEAISLIFAAMEKSGGWSL